jgi:hypothetical protein
MVSSWCSRRCLRVGCSISEFHMRCLRPALTSLPFGDWMCYECLDFQTELCGPRRRAKDNRWLYQLKTADGLTMWENFSNLAPALRSTVLSSTEAGWCDAAKDDESRIRELRIKELLGDDPSGSSKPDGHADDDSLSSSDNKEDAPEPVRKKRMRRRSSFSTVRPAQLRANSAGLVCCSRDSCLTRLAGALQPSGLVRLV